MKTKCPSCQFIQYIPEHYANKEIKCPECKEPFVATEYVEPDPLPQPKPATRPKLRSSRWLNVTAIFVAIFAILGIFISIGNESAEGALFCISWLFLSFILVGMSDIVEAVNANTRSRRRGYDE